MLYVGAYVSYDLNIICLCKPASVVVEIVIQIVWQHVDWKVFVNEPNGVKWISLVLEIIRFLPNLCLKSSNLA